MNRENLWAPWRMAYLRELDRRQRGLGATDDWPADFLAVYWSEPEDDLRNHVIHRDRAGMILLNRYPYANGHLMIALGEARPVLRDYEPAQRAAFWQLVELGMELMHRTLNPQGINMGINEGAAAGAGVPEHLHAHLVPRWSADTNFITVVGDVRIVPESLQAIAQQYRRTLETMEFDR